MSNIKALLAALDAFEGHLDEVEGESLHDLGRKDEVESNPAEVGAEDCPLCATGKDCPEHQTKPSDGLAENLAKLGGDA